MSKKLQKFRAERVRIFFYILRDAKAYQPLNKAGVRPGFVGRANYLIFMKFCPTNKKKDKLPESLYHSFVSLCQAISHVHNQTNIRTIKRFHPKGIVQRINPFVRLWLAIWLGRCLIKYDKTSFCFSEILSKKVSEDFT